MDLYWFLTDDERDFADICYNDLNETVQSFSKYISSKYISQTRDAVKEGIGK